MNIYKTHIRLRSRLAPINILYNALNVHTHSKKQHVAVNLCSVKSFIFVGNLWHILYIKQAVSDLDFQGQLNKSSWICQFINVTKTCWWNASKCWWIDFLGLSERPIRFDFHIFHFWSRIPWPEQSLGQCGLRTLQVF